MFLKDAMNTDFGSVVISIILGLGLAALFRQVCDDDQCLVITAPEHDYVTSNTFKFDKGCYSFETEMTSCENKKNLIRHN